MTKTSQNKGHRKRLREKFLKSPESLFDYEILEMILFASHMIKDTKPLAKELIKKFGNFKKVINAEECELKKVKGLGVSGIAALKTIKESCDRLLKKDIEKFPVLDDVDKLCRYCRNKIGHLKTEQLRVLYINSVCQLVADEILSEGSISETPIYKNIIVTKATLHGAPSVVLVHNHPSGNADPSMSDIKATVSLKRILGELGIELLDHVIVSTNESYSMRTKGLLESKKTHNDNVFSDYLSS